MLLLQAVRGRDRELTSSSMTARDLQRLRPVSAVRALGRQRPAIEARPWCDAPRQPVAKGIAKRHLIQQGSRADSRQQSDRILMLARLERPFEHKEVGINDGRIDRNTVARHAQKIATNGFNDLAEFEQALTQTCPCMRFKPARSKQLAQMVAINRLARLQT